MKGAYDDEAPLKGRKFVPQKYLKVSDAAAPGRRSVSRWLPALGWLRTLQQGLAAG